MIYCFIPYYRSFAIQIDIPQHRIQLWPGYMTSIRQHERDVLMCVEIGTKLMRMETILDIMIRIRNSFGQNWLIQFKNTVIGSIVLTNYNNTTYRVDDIEFDSNPESTFETKNGPISFVEYYRSVSSFIQII